MKAAGVAWKQIFRQSDISHALKENIATTHEPTDKGKGKKNDTRARDRKENAQLNSQVYPVCAVRTDAEINAKFD